VSVNQPVLEAMRAAVKVIESEKIAYGLIGGAALSQWGRVRFTQDVDLLIVAGEKDLERLSEPMRKAGFTILSPRPRQLEDVVLVQFQWLCRQWPKACREAEQPPT